MSHEPDRRARTLWPLPGGNGSFLRTLRSMLVEARKGRTPQQMTNFVVTKYPGVTSAKAAHSYYYVTSVLGLTSKQMGLTTITEDGEAFINTRDATIIRRALIERISGVTEIIELLDEEPRRIGLILTALNEQGFGWTTTSQLRYRLRWLEECKVIDRVGRGRPEYQLRRNVEAGSILSPYAPRSESGPPKVG